VIVDSEKSNYRISKVFIKLI